MLSTAMIGHILAKDKIPNPSTADTALPKPSPIAKTKGTVTGPVVTPALSQPTFTNSSDEKNVRRVEIKRGDITVHDERVVHGSGPNESDGWRRAYVLAFRTAEMVDEERRLGFSHSHNDAFNWDAFHAWQDEARPETT